MSLSEVYAKVPHIRCKGLCDRYCGPVPVSRRELKAMRRASGKRLRIAYEHSNGHVTLKPRKNWHCPCLKGNRCTIYEDRPLICRVWGVAEDLECPHGCKPSRVMTKDEVFILVNHT